MRFNVRDQKRQRVLFSTEECRRVEAAGELANLAPRVAVESLVSLGKGRPGDYIIEAEILERPDAPTARLQVVCQIH